MPTLLGGAKPASQHNVVASCPLIFRTPHQDSSIQTAKAVDDISALPSNPIYRAPTDVLTVPTTPSFPLHPFSLFTTRAHGFSVLARFDLLVFSLRF